MLAQSILDNDQYKFTMQQAVLELFPDADAEYTFINRGGHKFNSGEFDSRLRHEIYTEIGKLRLTSSEEE